MASPAFPNPTFSNGRSTYIGLLSANTILSSAMPMLIILSGLAGIMLAPSPIFATFPASVQMLAGLMATGPLSLFMGRFGRRAGFALGAACAILGGMAAVWALTVGSFALLCLAHMALGAALACYQYFRFAAAEVVPAAWQPVAISLMLTSGLVAAFIGPQVFIWTQDAFTFIPLAGAYAAISGLSLVGVVPLLFVRMAATTAKPAIVSAAGSLLILRRPQVLSAVALGAVSQGVMVFLMAPTPLAMIGCGFSETLAGDVIRWHVVAMFAPSFVTGFIIQKFGVVAVARVGVVLLIASALIAASGLSQTHFYIALIVLGIGWNFGFIGATTMLANAVPADERSVAQGANDTIIALASTLCAFLSGVIVTGPGWTALVLTSLPILGIALLLLVLPRRAPA